MSARPSAILTWHSFDASGSPISVTPECFAAQMASLAASGVPVVPLERLSARPGSVALTFDDAFASFYEHALPELQRHGFPATVFVVSAHAGQDNGWPSQPSGIPRFPLMSWSRLEEIAKLGIALGAHTARHPFLTRLPPAEVERELHDGQRELENRTGRRVETFAYPYGDWNGAVRECAGRFFRIACTTDMRFADPADHPLALPRIDAWYLQQPFWMRHLHATPGRTYVSARAGLRRLRRVLAA